MGKEINENLTLIIGIASGILVPIILYLATRKNWGQKRYMLSKFNHNKEKVQKYAQDLRQLLEETNAWDSIMFKEQNATYRECLEMMEERFKIEYSDAQFIALKKKKLSKYEVEEYIQKLKVQEDNLNLLRPELDLIIKKFSNK